jgi:hypothetical protein
MASGETPGGELLGDRDQGCGVGGGRCTQARGVGGGRRWGRADGEVGHGGGGVGGAAARTERWQALQQRSRGRLLGAPLQEEDRRPVVGAERWRERHDRSRKGPTTARRERSLRLGAGGWEGGQKN